MCKLTLKFEQSNLKRSMSTLVKGKDVVHLATKKAYNLVARCLPWLPGFLLYFKVKSNQVCFCFRVEISRQVETVDIIFETFTFI